MFHFYTRENVKKQGLYLESLFLATIFIFRTNLQVYGLHKGGSLQRGGFQIR